MMISGSVVLAWSTTISGTGSGEVFAWSVMGSGAGVVAGAGVGARASSFSGSAVGSAISSGIGSSMISSSVIGSGGVCMDLVTLLAGAGGFSTAVTVMVAANTITVRFIELLYGSYI